VVVRIIRQGYPSVYGYPSRYLNIRYIKVDILTDIQADIQEDIQAEIHKKQCSSEQIIVNTEELEDN